MATPEIKTVFGRALELETPESRVAYLNEACGDGTPMRREVEALLRALDKAGDFMATPVAARADTVATVGRVEGPGTVVGPYHLLELIGEGGMGVVYLAEQRQPVQRKVALKILKPGLDTRQVVERFEAERQALAVMDHPHVARILDGGTTEAGRPYFVMDYVVGVPITEYCDRERLRLRERLDLFIAVCLAVQHAHQKGIIHRDLKPSNILVVRQDGQAAPKIIDFGIAKAIHSPLMPSVTATSAGHLIGTPQYMSPEQAEPGRLDIDTRSDVYSLGVVVYELLAGVTPVSAETIRNADFETLVRLIRQEEPRRPSDRVAARQAEAERIAEARGSDPAELARELRGDLDWIVTKALEKDRNRRYDSPAELARDIERYLRDEPVLAGPPSVGYRLRKLVWRHRYGFAAAAAVLLALVGGIVGTTVGMVRALEAERIANGERDRAIAAEGVAESERAAAVTARRDVEAAHRRTRAALDTLTDGVVVATLGQQRELGPGQQRFLQQIEQHYQALADARGETEISRANRANGNWRVSQIRRTLGDLSGAERCVRQAVAMYERLVADYPAEAGHRRGLAGAMNDLGAILNDRGRHAEAEVAFRASVEMVQQLVDENPNSAADRRMLAAAKHDLGLGLSALRRLREAEDLFREAVAMRAEIAAAGGDSIANRRMLAWSIESLASLLGSARRLDESAREYRKSLAIWDELLAEQPSDESALNGRALTSRGLASVLFVDRRYEEAERVLGVLILDLRKLAADYPALPGYRASLASGLRGMGNTLRKLGRLSDAEQTYRESLAIYAKLAEGPYATAVDAFNLGTAMLGLARVANAGGRSSEAQQIIERAMTTIKPAVESNPGNYLYQRMWHRAMRWQLSLAAARGEHEEGARWVDRISGSGLASAKELADCSWRMGQLTWLVWRDGRLGRDEKWRTTQGHAIRAVRLFSAAGIQLCREWFLAPATPAVKGMELEE